MEPTLRDVRRELRRDARVLGRNAQTLVAEVEELMERVGHSADPEIGRVRARVESAVAATRRSLADGFHGLEDRASETIDAGDRYVRERPWPAIGVAALTGLALGILVSRR
jgi:ElaB/YqjD/DUF883 family membrane-anchored ribosome-binding protein